MPVLGSFDKQRLNQNPCPYILVRGKVGRQRNNLSNVDMS